MLEDSFAEPDRTTQSVIVSCLVKAQQYRIANSIKESVYQAGDKLASLEENVSGFNLT